MQPILSVLLCTHNPRLDYLEQVLQALKGQTLSLDQWELLVIDNASDRPLLNLVDLGWHPLGRQLQEPKLGLTAARLRGFQEATADLLVLVDDDNVLAPDYLEQALQISRDWPMLGAWGGQSRPVFETPPPEWTRRYWWMLALREFEHDQWSNLVHQWETTPNGAGMCLRRAVAHAYSQRLSQDSRRGGLDRRGRELTSSGDLDLACTACDMGLGTGQFVRLQLQHLIPSERLEEGYLLELMESILYSKTILNAYRGRLPKLRNLWLRKVLELSRGSGMSPRDRRFHQACMRGVARGLKEIQVSGLPRSATASITTTTQA